MASTLVPVSRPSRYKAAAKICHARCWETSRLRGYCGVRRATFIEIRTWGALSLHSLHMGAILAEVSTWSLQQASIPLPECLSPVFPRSWLSRRVRQFTATFRNGRSGATPGNGRERLRRPALTRIASCSAGGAGGRSIPRSHHLHPGRHASEATETPTCGFGFGVAPM